MIGALLLAVSTYPPLLPRGVLVQVVESAALWSLGAWLGRGRAPLGPVGGVVTAAWVAVTLGLQDVQSVDLGLDPVGWAPAVVLGTVVLLAARGGVARVAVVPAIVLVAVARRPAHAHPAGGGVADVRRRTRASGRDRCTWTSPSARAHPPTGRRRRSVGSPPRAASRGGRW